MVIAELWSAVKAQNRKAPLLLTIAAFGDASLIFGVIWLWRNLRHHEDNRRYYYENYPFILSAYYFGLNMLTLAERLGDKQKDSDLAKWIYNDVKNDNVGTLLSDIWEEKEETETIKTFDLVKRPRLQR